MIPPRFVVQAAPICDFFPNSHNHARGDRRADDDDDDDDVDDDEGLKPRGMRKARHGRPESRQGGDIVPSRYYLSGLSAGCPIGHANICLSKITFLLMLANVYTLANRRGV